MADLHLRRVTLELLHARVQLEQRHESALPLYNIREKRSSMCHRISRAHSVTAGITCCGVCSVSVACVVYLWRV